MRDRCVFCLQRGGDLEPWAEWMAHRGCADQHAYDQVQQHEADMEQAQ